RTRSPSARARCTRLCTASRSASGSPPSGSSRSATAARSSTGSRCEGANSCALRRRRGSASSPPSVRCSARPSNRADMTAARWRRLLPRLSGDARGDLDSEIRDACLTIDRRRERRLALTEYFGMIVQDVRHVVRAMRTAPGFALLVTLTLALGVGATTAMYSVLDAVALRPLAYAASNRVVMLYDVQHDAADAFPASYPEFLDW